MSGTITLSLEIELGWGYHDLRRFDKFSADRIRTTRTLEKLLDVCDDLDLPITFDVVGALFHEEMSDVRTGPHPDGWFETVREADSSKQTLFCAPDLVRNVDQSDTDHEICTHTYSHVLCNKMDERVVDWELSTAADLTERRLGHRPVSLVPPRHSSPPKDVLRENGIEIVRTIGSDSAPTKLHKFNDLLFDPPEPMSPSLVDGVVETYCTPYTTLTASTLPSGQRSSLRGFRPIPRRVRQRMHRRYLEAAVEKAVAQDACTHLWGHLHDLGNNDQWRPIRSFLETLAARRDRGEVEVLTMEQLNDRVRNRSSAESTTETDRVIPQIQ